MKTITAAILICLVSFCGLSQTSIERMGARFNWDKDKPKPTAEDEALKKTIAIHTENFEKRNAINNTNNYRVVEGKLYNAALSTNWVDLPGKLKRGVYVRPATGGSVFRIEKQMSDPSAGSRATWYEYDREIIVLNYPTRAVEAGGAMQSIRALPIKTTASGATIYDFGVAPTATAGLRTNSGSARPVSGPRTNSIVTPAAKKK